VYTPGPSVVGTETVFPYTDGGRLVRLEASTSVAYTIVYIITLQVTVDAAAPTVTAISPAQGSIAGGTSVAITGTNFTGATAVRFGTTAATGYTVNSATSITATAPPGTAGTVDVTVTTGGGTSATSAADQFTYLAPPTLTAAFSPTTINVGGTSALTYTVTNPNTATSLTGVALSNADLPSGLTLANNPLSSTCNGTVNLSSGGGASLTGASLNPSSSCTITVQVQATSGGSYSFTTGVPSASGPTSLTGAAATTNTLTVNAPTLGVAFANSGTNYQGLTATYTLTPSATTATATSGTINATITLPAGLTFASATGTGWTCTGVAACSYSSAIAGNSSGNPLTLVLNVAGNATGTLSPSVQLSGGGASNIPSATASTAITAPSISNVSPSSVSTAGGTTVTLTGAGFSASGNTLTIGGSAVTIATQSTTQITFAAPAGQSNGATPQIVVTNSGGGQASSTGLTFVSPPAVTSVSPTSGTTAGGTVVTLTGTNFTGATAVTFGVTAAAGFTVNSATSITATAPAGAAGTVNIRVTTPNGTSSTSAANQFTYVVPAPTVTSLSPTSGTTAGGTVVTLTGANFTGATGVSFGATAATSFTVNSATSITATAPAGAAGTVNVTVTTAGGTSATGAANQFTYVTPAPVVATVTPSSGTTAGGTVVTLTGTDFLFTNDVSFGGVSAANFVVTSATSIIATAPSRAAGTINITVTTPGGTSATGASNQFTYVTPAPTVASVSPTSGTTAGGTVVTLTGTNFTGATGVSFGATAATSFTVNSATSITATAPAGAAGTVNVTVTTPGGTSSTSAANQFTYVVPAPTVASLSPTSGTTAGGTVVTLTGTNFTGATGVSFGATAATSFTVNSATSITATAPAGAAGTVNVTVTTAGGTSATGAANQFTYVTPAPVVATVTPSSGTTAGGTVVALEGANFSGATGVSFGGTPAANFIVNSAASITATAPPRAAGTINITVTTAGGTSATGAANQFTYVTPAPTVASVSPTSGTTAGGTVVTLTGTNFTGATAVRFGATAATSFTVNSATSITATAPAGAPGTVDVTVTTPGGTSATGANDRFTYFTPTLTLAPTTLTNPVYGTPYSQTVTASGGNGTYSYAVTAGALPAGLTLSTGGTLSGTATVTGTFNFTITATDTSAPPITGSRAYSVTIAAPTIVVSPSSLVAVVNPSPGNSYTTAISATGGIGPYSFTVTAGSPPPGLTVSSTGVFSGTPTAGGSFSFTVTATDAGGFTGSRAYTVPVNPPSLAMTPTTLPGGTGGTAYSQTLGVIGGGTAPFTYSLTAGALPPGLALSGAGVLSGTPSATGTFNFTVTATDSSTGTGPYSVSQAYSVTIGAPTISIAPDALNAATAGLAFSQTLTASGGSAPYSFAVTAGALPVGTTLSGAGVLSGTPITPGTYNFTVTATATGGFTGTRAYSWTVNPSTLAFTPATLANATVGTAYNAPLSATGGTAPYSFAVTAGALPAGLTLGTAISGTPTAGGTFNFTITLTDGGGASTNRAYTLTVAPPTLAISPTALPAATLGTAYNQTLTASGGTAPRAFAVTAGALPTGLSLSTAGVLSGTPTVAGTYNFSITVTDSSTGTGPFTAVQAYTIVASAPTITIGGSPSAGTVGVAYPGVTFTASGGVGPYGFAVTSGALPAGLTLSTTGTLSGTPTAGGSFSFTVTATDARGFTGAQALTLTVAAPTLAIGPGSLATGAFGSAYSQTFTLSGGTAPARFAVTAGALPAGLNLSAAGVLSGTPTAASTFNFTVTATDSSTGTGPYSASQAFSVTIAAPTITLTPAALPGGSVATAYNTALTATGGTGPYSFAVTSGALPAGVTLATNGTLAGTPSAGGSFSVTVTATDAGGFTGTRAYTLAIAAPTLAIAPTTLPAGRVGTAYAQNVTASGGTAPYRFAVTAGALPGGVTLAADGALSGTPTSAGSFAFTITATDGSTGAGPYSVAQAYNVTIAEAAPVAGAVTATVAYASTGNAIALALSGGPATSVTVASPPGNGTATASGTGISYTPAPTFIGTDRFTYTATGPGGTSAPATVTVTVAPPPPPVVTNLSVTTAYQTARAIDLSPAVTGVSTGVAIMAGPAHGAATLSGTTVTYTPAAGYIGADSFTFTASGPGGTSAPATVTVTVAPPPPPVASAVSVTTPYQTARAIDLSTAVTGVSTGIAVATAPTSGTTSLSGTTVTYTPNAGFFGTDSFTYTASGPGGTSAPATVTITVSTPPPPVATGGSISTGFETAQTIDVARLVTGVSTSIAIGTRPTNGTATVSGTVITYTPATDFAGADSFTYTATGPGGTSAPATISVTVAPLPPPAPAPRQATTDSNRSVTFDVTTGLRGAPFTVAIATPPPSGQASVQGGVISFTPAPNSPPNVRFTFTVTSRFGTSQPTPIDVAVNVVPVPVPLKTAQTLAGTTVTVNLTDGATGGPFTAATLSGPLDPSVGSATISRQGDGFVLSFTAGQTYAGVARIGYTLSNSYTTSVPATVEVTVNARPDPTTDPNVRSIIDTQVQTSQRFATQQIRIIGSRLEQLHDGGGTGFTNRLTIGGSVITNYALGDIALINAYTSFNPYARLSYEGGYNALTGGAGRSAALRGDLGGLGGGARPIGADRTTGLGVLNGAAGGFAGGLGGTEGGGFDADGALRAGGAKSYGGGDNPLGAWLGGSIEFGNRDPVGGNGAFRFTTGGVTGGLDYRFSDKFILGGSIGYGQDLTDLQNGQGRVSSTQYSGAIYASAQPAPKLFIDGLFGYGRTNFDTRRLAQQTGATITGNRDSEQIFAALNITYEYRGKRLWVAPYGRLDYVGSTLFDYTERGDNVFALRVLDQSSTLVTGSAGLRLRYALPFAGGTLTPTARAEVQYDLEQGGSARLRYADLGNGFIYSFSSQQYSRTRALFGAGLSYFIPQGVKLKLDYEGTVLSSGSNHLFRITAGIAF